MDATFHHDYYKKSGQIPAFGNWDYSNDLPITQYFECARQAGLIRYSSSSGDSSDPYLRGNLYAVDQYPQKIKPSARTVDNPLPGRKTRGGREKRCPHVKEQKKQQQQAKVCDVTEPQRKPLRNDAVSRPAGPAAGAPPHRLPKPVDEDLYKIPPELLHASKRTRGGREKRCPHVKEQKKQQQQAKVCDVTEPQRKPLRNDAVSRPAGSGAGAPPHRLPKPVDEDLYKIPPELLHASKRKRRLGIFSRCLVPACTS